MQHHLGHAAGEEDFRVHGRRAFWGLALATVGVTFGPQPALAQAGEGVDPPPLLVLLVVRAPLRQEHGVDGVIVSNHGARSEDSGRSTIDALPEIAEAVTGIRTADHKYYPIKTDTRVSVLIF